ncbi:MAG: SDR family oxidoreductase [Deltaproteobacteria bacterium]|nr:SDR family oxidoreductase [Deltaproteobacteria bacterium]
MTRAKARSRRRQVLVTGYPGFIGKQLVRKLLKTEPESDFTLLVQERFVDSAQRYVRASRRKNLERVHILSGDIADMHLGLSASELKNLTRKLTDIYHLAAISYLGAPEELMRRVNIQGTINLLEVAEQSRKLRRFNHVSTCYVSGDREGVITEEELDCGQGFRNPYEMTKHEAEIRVRRAMDSLPISVYRPSIVVGDSRTGEIGRFDGPYYLGMLMAATPLSMPLPLPGEGGAPLNMVPVDYVVDAISWLSMQPDAQGVTFHVVDPNPLSVRGVYTLIAERLGVEASRIRMGTGLTRSVLSGLSSALQMIPGLEKISRFPRQAIDLVNTISIYNNPNTTNALKGSRIECPPFESYVDKLIAYVKSTYASQRSRDADEDPLA